MRIKAEQFEVEDPRKAMVNFQSLLSRLVKVPKAAVATKGKVKAKAKKKLKG